MSHLVCDTTQLFPTHTHTTHDSARRKHTETVRRSARSVGVWCTGLLRCGYNTNRIRHAMTSGSSSPSSLSSSVCCFLCWTKSKVNACLVCAYNTVYHMLHGLSCEATYILVIPYVLAMYNASCMRNCGSVCRHFVYYTIYMVETDN